MENNNEKKIKDLNITSEETVEEVIAEEIFSEETVEKIGEKIGEKAEENEVFVAVDEVAAQPLKFGKKQIVFMITVCFALCVVALLLLPTNNDKKRADGVTPTTSTTQSLMEEFAIEHNLIVTTTAKTTPTVTTSTAATTARFIVTTTNVTTSKSVTTTAKTIDETQYADLEKVVFTPEKGINSGNAYAEEDLESYYTYARSEFDGNLPTAPIYKKRIYAQEFPMSDGTTMRGYLGDGLLTTAQMEEIVYKAVEDFDLEILRTSWTSGYGNQSTHYDYPPDLPSLSFAAVCKAAKVEVTNYGGVNITINNYRFPEGYKVLQNSYDEKYNASEQQKTMEYLLDTYGSFLEMENPVIDVEGKQITDKNDNTLQNPYVNFSTYQGQLNVSRSYSPKDVFLGDYPIITSGEARQKLLDGDFYCEFMNRRSINMTVKSEDIVAYESVFQANETAEYTVPYYAFLVDCGMLGTELYDDQPEYMNEYYNQKFYVVCVVPAVEEAYIA